jgi:carbon-monoxide dehydrogenase small subunit
MKVRFTLNGRPVSIDVAADRPVVRVLREELGLTGTKECCGVGECGGCTVLVDGQSRLSCLMLAAQLEDREVVTVEGFGTPDHPHPLQEAFVTRGAVQCGYCTPGMIVAAADLLNRRPDPGREEIRDGLSGNLCRCTGYHKIVDAVQAAAGVSRESDDDRS